MREPPDMRNGAHPVTSRENAAAVNATSHHQEADARHRTASDRLSAIVAFGVVYLASGRATKDWLVVACCPLCKKGHRHVLGGLAASYERSPSCRPSRKYSVKVTRVVPDVVTPTQWAVAS